MARSGRQRQLDLAYARELGVLTAGLLVSQLSDLIKMASTASTAYVTDIRLEGLVVLRDVIEVCGMCLMNALDVVPDLCEDTGSGLRICASHRAASSPCHCCSVTGIRCPLDARVPPVQGQFVDPTPALSDQVFPTPIDTPHRYAYPHPHPPLHFLLLTASACYSYCMTKAPSPTSRSPTAARRKNS